jgi:hypothetical protein
VGLAAPEKREEAVDVQASSVATDAIIDSGSSGLGDASCSRSKAVRYGPMSSGRSRTCLVSALSVHFEGARFAGLGNAAWSEL